MKVRYGYFQQISGCKKLYYYTEDEIVARVDVKNVNIFKKIIAKIIFVFSKKDLIGILNLNFK